MAECCSGGGGGEPLGSPRGGLVCFLSFLLLMWSVTLISHTLNHSCNPGMNPAKSLFMIYCFVGFGLLTFYREFFIYIHQRYSSKTCDFVYL